MLKIDGLPLAELKKRKSVKWRGFESDVLPLPVAEMDFEIAEPIRQELIQMIEVSDTGYLGPIPELGANFATFAKNRWGWELDSASIMTATDVGVGAVEIMRTIVKPGDGIVINTPVYHNFANWINEVKCTIVEAPLHRDGMTYTLDLAPVEKAYAAGAKAHLLCNPHNPVGTVFTRDELIALAELAKKHGVTIISDEIHAPLTYKSEEFHPFLSVSATAREVGVCITAASKSWNLAGLKCAFIVTGSEREHQNAEKMPQAVHYRASLFGAVAAARAFTCTEWLDSTLMTLDRNRNFLKELLDDHLPEAGYRIPDCSYLAWIDMSAYGLGPNPSERLLKEGKVAFNAGEAFCKNHAQFIRLNFGTSEEILEEAIHRVVGVVRVK